MNRDIKPKFTNFASIMERAVVALDRADEYMAIVLSDSNMEPETPITLPIRECIRVIDATTEQVRMALENAKKRKAKTSDVIADNTQIHD